MALISDILLIAGALGAAFYCIVLSRKLSRLGNLDTGMGAAIATLSAQVTDLTRTIDKAHAAARASSVSLDEVTRRAQDASRKLELQMASLHDLPKAVASKPAKAPARRRAPKAATPRREAASIAATAPLAEPTA
jgi:hypothetical protein